MGFNLYFSILKGKCFTVGYGRRDQLMSGQMRSIFELRANSRPSILTARFFNSFFSGAFCLCFRFFVASLFSVRGVGGRLLGACGVGGYAGLAVQVVEELLQVGIVTGGRSLVKVGGGGRLVAEHDPVLYHVAVRPQLLQVLFLATGPLRDLVDGAVHARVVHHEQPHHTRLGPDVALFSGVSYLALHAVARGVARPLRQHALVPPPAVRTSDSVGRELHLVV